MNKLYENYIQILKEELVPAMGCTEPIAIAYAASIAKETLNEPIKRVIVRCSSNIIKNVHCVKVPNTNGLIGVEVAALAGIVAGESTRKLEVISQVSDIQKAEIAQLLEHKICEVTKLNTPLTLHLIVEVMGHENQVAVEITQTHTHVESIYKNGVRVDVKQEEMNSELMDRSCLSVSKILQFANEIELNEVMDLIQPQIENNMAISRVGKSGNYGVNLATLIMQESESITNQMAAAAACASEARMDGCSMPVVTNSGSGNQGITASVPILVYCEVMKIPKEKMIRALLVSNLLTIHQKTGIGHLSAFCGVVSASSAVAGAITWLQGGTELQIGQAIKNTLASLSGILCDGAKITCGFKIASGIHAAMLASKMAMQHCSYTGNIGIIKESVEETIQVIGHLAKKGMDKTDQVILDIMLNKNGN